MLRQIRTIAFAVMSMSAVCASAQDLLANRAPSDRKLTDLKAIKIAKTEAIVDLNNPAGHIYSTWDDQSALIAPGALPANFKIDLRGFAMPTPSRKINSVFGPRWGKQHKGLDLKVYTGDTIYAAFDGKVRITKFNAGGWGYYVVIRHPNGLETLYGHLSKQLVKEDQIVRAGQPIGLGGNTGKSNGSHLHFETRLLGVAINPALLFDFERQDVTGDFYVLNSSSKQGPKIPTTAVASTLAVSDEMAEAKTVSVASKTLPQTTEQPAGAPASEKKEQPAPAASKSDAIYVVKDGDNLFRIATNHGLTLDQLCRMNGLKPNSLIVRGQQLKVKS